jgi:hypothetical protein
MKLLILLLFSSAVFGQKDSLYWNHIYHPNRLIFKKSDTVFIGTVIKVIKENDGDYHVLVANNTNTLNVEIICAYPEKNLICAGYNNKIPIPKKGMKVEIFGDYVFDNKHKWPEIHPVKSIKIL